MKPWKTTEVKILRDYYPDQGYRACAERLPDRTEGAIYCQLRNLGIRRNGRPNKPTVLPDTDEINAVIRETYQAAPERGGVQALADRLGVHRQAITRRAQQLGVAVPRIKRSRWSREELEILEDNERKGNDSIRMILISAGYSRSLTAIEVMRQRMRLQPADPDLYTASGLAGYLGISRNTVSRWVLAGKLPAHRQGTARTQAQGGDHWSIRRQDVRKFIIANPQEIDLRKVDREWFIELMGECP